MAEVNQRIGDLWVQLGEYNTEVCFELWVFHLLKKKVMKLISGAIDQGIVNIDECFKYGSILAG